MKKIVLLIIFVFAFTLMLFSATMDSITTDEGVHIFSGYTYLTLKDFRLDPEHPPLLKELGALPLLFTKNLNYSLGQSWDKAGNFYYDSWKDARILADNFIANNSDSIVVYSRIIFILLTMILGLFSYFWAKKLYGEKAGIFAAFLILFLPNILAHGRLVNTDLGLSLFFFIAIYFWGKFLKEPKLSNMIFAGIFLGLVLASKFTGIIIIPIFVILIIIKLILQKSWKNWGKFILGFVLSGVISFIIIWGTYGFSLKTPPELSFTKAMSYISVSYYDSYNKIRPIFFPADYFKGLAMVKTHALNGQNAYLLGKTSIIGWWYYFPVAIFYKTPISIFFLLIISIFYFRKNKAKDIFDEYLILIPPIVFLLFAMSSKANLGVRHVLPIFPFLILFVSKSINLVDFKKWRLATIGFIVLIFWYILSAILPFPYYIAYFNEFAGGPGGGYKILTDSNLDWGQDVFRIKKYVDDNNLQDYYLVYGWDGDQYLRKNGIDYTFLEPKNQNISGDVIISVSSLVGEDYNWLLNYPKTQITPGVFHIKID